MSLKNWIATVFSLVFVLDAAAFAARVDIATGLLQHEQIQINGNLGCDSGRAPAGMPCALMIEDLKTGKTYRLEKDSVQQAMQLYQAGKRNVAIEGSLTDWDTIRVSQAKSL